MKILRIVACLAFASVAMAQSQQGVLEVNERRGPTPEERALLDSELTHKISELHFRSALLSRPIPSQQLKSEWESFAKPGPVQSGTGKCYQAMSVLSSLFDKLLEGASQIDIPLFSQFINLLIGIPKSGFKLAEASVAVAIQSGLHGANLASHALEEAFHIVFSYTGLLPDELIGGPFSAIQQALDAAVACFNSASSVSNKIEDQFSVASCGFLADLYRGTVDEVASKPFELPADAPENLERAVSGAQAVVNLSKASIPASNDDLLKTRSFFVADILDQYREEVNRLGTTDDVKNYAQLSLSSVVASSNALEACLRIAANTDVAVEELNEELDAVDDDY
ncbi:hypothetical protein EMPS_02084 [Entomortierella parvispora]|uniref:Uncharacterized protein n=1 Tax=Entomortierella parvispora TaxID=205924 RepID=A0A9P3H445_9FUNG|nr:hypothetical protein EMPS_02084 [Entomortierella parvispora]